MALAKNVNSYVTLTEADAYFADRLDADAWTSTDATNKAKALITATGQLDQMSWVGVAVSNSQKLAFPRSLSYYDPKLGAQISTAGTPDRVLNATYELALHLLTNEGVLDSGSSVMSLSVDTIRLDTITPAEKIPGIVRTLIKPLLVNNGAQTWWRAN
jgi:hypothetical protein